MRDPFSRTMLDTRLPCRQSKTLYMELAVVCRILQRDLSPKLMERTWMKPRFFQYRQ